MITDFEGKVAVVTGGARGIGAAMGKVFAERGMKVVLADVLAEPLDATVAELRAAGLEVVGEVTDVTSLASVEALRDATVSHYGAVHLVCNNAAVSSGATGMIWEYQMVDWRWAFDVNVLGVLHGINAFTQLMIDQGEGHVVNTSSSNGGLITGTGGSAIYPTTKSAVVTITECLWANLKTVDAPVGASVLFPGTRTGGLLNTGIWQPGTNRPARYAKANDPNPDGFDTLPSYLEAMQKAGVEVKFANLEEIGETVLDGVAENRFWITAHDPMSMRPKLEQRLQSQLHSTDPIYLQDLRAGMSTRRS